MAGRESFSSLLLSSLDFSDAKVYEPQIDAMLDQYGADYQVLSLILFVLLYYSRV